MICAGKLLTFGTQPYLNRRKTDRGQAMRRSKCSYLSLIRPIKNGCPLSSRHRSSSSRHVRIVCSVVESLGTCTNSSRLARQPGVNAERSTYTPAQITIDDLDSQGLHLISQCWKYLSRSEERKEIYRRFTDGLTFLINTSRSLKKSVNVDETKIRTTLFGVF